MCWPWRRSWTRAAEVRRQAVAIPCRLALSAVIPLAPASSVPSRIMAYCDNVGTVTGGAGAGPMNWPKEKGPFPTATVVTALVAVSITETLFEPLLAT